MTSTAPADLEQGAGIAGIEAALGIHVPLLDYIEKTLASCFGRQPDMSGDQRKRLNRDELRMVYYAAKAISSDMLRIAAFRDAACGAEGFVLVPREPTPEMIARGKARMGYNLDATALDFWSAMLAAAPKTTPQPGSRSGEREAIARQLYEWMPCVLEASIEAEGPGSFAYATWEQLGENVRQSFREKAAQIALIPAADAVGATFKLGDRVEKTKGSSWTGLVVGTYSTTLTPEGYAVESENEPGSVQIYPAKALRAAPTGGDHA